MTGGFSYIVEMVDQISGPAKSARQVIEDMTGGLAKQKAELERTREAFAALADQGPVTEKEMQSFTRSIAQQESAIERQAAAIRKAVATEEASAAQAIAAEQKKASEIARTAKAAQDAQQKFAQDTIKASQKQVADEMKRQKSLTDAYAKTVDEWKKNQAKGAEDAKATIEKRIDAAKNAIAVGKDTVVASFLAMGAAARSFAAGDLKGAADGVTQSLAGMVKLLDLAVPGLGQAAAMVVTVAGGFVGITVGLIQKGAELALEASQAKTAMLSLFDAMGGGAVTGAQVEAVIDKVKASTGFAKDELVGYTKQLLAMGETDLGDLEGSMKALAASTALAGKEGASALLAMKARVDELGDGNIKLADKQMSKLFATGANLEDVAKQMGKPVATLRAELAAGTVKAADFGRALEDALIKKGPKALGTLTSQLPNLKKLLQESIGDLFEDVDVTPFLSAVKELFAVFSQASPVGQRMKEVVGGSFNLLFKLAGDATTAVKILFLTIANKALEGYIAMKPIIKSIREFFASPGGAKLLGIVLGVIVSALKGLAIAVVFVVGVFATLWATAAAIAIVFWSLIGAVVSFGVTLGQGFAKAIADAIQTVWTLGSAIGDALAAAWLKINEWTGGAAQAAVDFVTGLVNGITQGATQVVDAVGNLASSATSAFKNALGIHSPSRVMMQLGEHTTEGFTQGVEGGAEDAQAALEATAQPPTAPATATGAPSSSSSGISVSVTIAPGAIVAGGANASELLELLTSQLADKLEEILMQMGGAKA